MGDDLGEEWWTNEGNSDASGLEEETKQPTEKEKTRPEKRKKIAQKTSKAKKKKTDVQKLKSQEPPPVPPKKETEDKKSSQPKKKRKKKKKTITDVLAASEPTPGRWSDLQALVTQHFADKRSVIELEELQLHDSCFLQSNDLTHTLSSYLKQICPKWAKIQKQHTEKSSVVLLVVCSSALRTIELIKQLTTFKGEAKVIKLFAKHIKIEEQVKLLQKGITHVGVGTPGRIAALIEQEGLNLQALRYVVLDWNWRDVKLRRMADIPEIKLDLMKLLESGVLAGCKENTIKLGLF